MSNPNNLSDYLSKKAQQLDLGRGDELTKIQKQLDIWYPGKAKAKSLNSGILTIGTPSSSVANELRFRKAQIMASHNSVTSIRILNK